MDSMGRKDRGQRIRVDFRPNRQERRRSDEWTQRYATGDERLDDTVRGEMVRAKGSLSRRRTIVVDADQLPAVDQHDWRQGVVTHVYGLTCGVVDAAGGVWECTVRRVLRTLMIGQRSGITCGDRIWFADMSAHCGGQPVGVIERVEPRRSVLTRRDARKRAHTIVANADQLLVVVSVAQPRLKPHLVDRYIVAGEKGRLRTLLCFNKMDLLASDVAADTADTEGEDAAAQPVLECITEFQRLGYPCLLTSATAGVGLDELRDALRDHVTVLSGQSGVGKSSLLNTLQPGLALEVQEVSTDTEKGRHTTTHAALLALDGGGFVVDTPGIRAFDIWNVAPGELEAYFVDFAPHLGKCRFADCAHRTETNCGVIAAVEAGEISLRRYHSYLKLLAEV
jgi:ribosome biogenesis GTPase